MADRQGVRYFAGKPLVTVIGTAILILGLLMIIFGSAEAMGMNVSGDATPGGSPAARILIGVVLFVLSMILRRLARAGRGK